MCGDIMILVLNGSPNKKGNTMFVVKELLQGVNEKIHYINVYDERINPCTDCKYCNYREGCKQNDIVQNIYSLLEKTDCLIIASPLYFATLSGELINLISRFQTYYAGKYIRKTKNPIIKKAVLVVTAGGNWPTMFDGVKETFNILKLLFCFEKSMEILIPNCDENNSIPDKKTFNQINNVKQFLFD